MVRSRGGLYKSKAVKNKSHFYLVLSIVFFFILVKWGFPGIINFIASSGSDKNSVGSSTVIPPQKPVFSSLPEATNSAHIQVKGYTKANVSTELLVDDFGVVTSISDADGGFEMATNLETGSHRIMVRAKDENGNTSDSEIKIINYDPSGVEVEIDEPSDGASFFSLDKNTILVKGSVNKEEVNIRINGTFTRQESDNSFQQSVMLSDGENLITVSVIDNAGNKTEKSIKVTYSR